ncbi:hypothetical protein ACLOJK_019322 [Asimina triloba]
MQPDRRRKSRSRNPIGTTIIDAVVPVFRRYPSGSRRDQRRRRASPSSGDSRMANLLFFSSVGVVPISSLPTGDNDCSIQFVWAAEEINIQFSIVQPIKISSVTKPMSTDVRTYPWQ